MSFLFRCKPFNGCNAFFDGVRGVTSGGEKPPRYRSVIEDELTEDEPSIDPSSTTRRMESLKRTVQMTFGGDCGDGTEKKCISKLIDVNMDVDRLRTGCFFTSYVYENLARQIFDMYDKNGDNVINVDELGGILEILGYSPTPEEVQQILERFDQDKSGTIDFDEYLVLIQHWIEQDETQIYDAFKVRERQGKREGERQGEIERNNVLTTCPVFDKDGDGFVSATELKRALTQYGEQFTEEEANEFFNMMDTDGDGFDWHGNKTLLSDICRVRARVGLGLGLGFGLGLGLDMVYRINFE
eukprot:sb/3467393/